MKIGPFRINLADKKPKIDSEVGTAASSGRSTLLGEEVVTLDKVSIEKLMNMLDNDGTVSALYNVLTLPIMANPWSIEPEDDSPEAKKQAEFVKEALSKPPHKGGMSTPFDLVLGDMLRAVLEKHRAFEKVFTLNPEGKIVYSKIASRDNSTISIRQDDRGGFNGIKQQGYIGGDYKTIIIEKEKCFLFTFGKHHNQLEGRSAFRSAYPHYVKKHKLYYLAEQAVQVGALPPKVVGGKAGAKQTDLDATVDAVDQLGVSSTVGLPDGYTLIPYEAGKGRIDPLPLIDHHNAEMARSILAQFIMLGSGGSTGSWALSQDQSDMFIIALRGLMSNIEEHITSYLLPDLINYNFATPKYPRFEFANITDAVATALKEVALKILDKRPEGIPDEMVKGVVEKLAAQLEIDLPEAKKATADTNGDVVLPEGGADVLAQSQEKIAQQALNGAQVSSLLDIIKQVITGQLPFDTAEATIKSAFPFLEQTTVDSILDPARNFKPAPALSRKKKDNVRLAETTWRRTLTTAEKKVNFSGIEKKHDQLEAEFIAKTQPIYARIQKDALDRLQAILDAKDYEAVATFELNFGDEYRNAMYDEMLAAYSYAKVGAADEIDVNAPATPAKSKDLLKATAQSIVDKQFGDLLFQIRETINQALRKNKLSKMQFTVGEVMAGLGGVMSAFYEDKIAFTAGLSVGSAINIGRDDVFSTNKEKISLYQYSAILDNTTCPICEDLDGSVVNEEEYRTTEWMPPIHGGCRCIWVAIMSDETEQPDETGFPDSPGDVSEAPISPVPTGTTPVEPLKNFKDDNLETIGQADIAGRPNAEINTKIENLLKSQDPAALRDAIRLSLGLPKDDIPAMLDSITLPDKTSVGNFFYTVKLSPKGKIQKVLKDAALDPTKMTAEEIAKLVGLG